MLLHADRSAAPQCFSPVTRSWGVAGDWDCFGARPARLELLAAGELERRKEQHILFVHLAA